ncbi:hypothetical protein [Candidatus Nitrosotenuis uzonensis]|uniref:Uncharacterized protein n=1 Tax=Candidatus Nitrosotenuis uzonensis TaxID=1407055 RepID=A0A812F997_9ARCH|nr:hypothetical protein [Candidatus Nitrosotenuis uzonensis]CAE6500974.1 exported hypothetical protein [Candidatus Nitrosotenuis uzonensis]
MTQITKNIGLLAMIPLFTMVLLVAYTGPAFAVDVNDQKSSVKVDRILLKGQGWYEVRLTVNVGAEDILGGKVRITSDTSNRDIELQKTKANSSLYLITTIQADSRDSIDVKLSEIKQKQGPSVPLTSTKSVASTNNQNPTLKVDSVLFKGQGRYEVRLTVNAGAEDFFGGKVRITSDTSNRDIELQQIKANSFVNLITTIGADSKTSITAKLTEIQQKQGPSVSYMGSTPITGSSAYLAQFQVNAGDENVSKVRLSIESDRETLEVVASGNNRSRDSGFIGANTYGITTVKLIANNPSSIKATILDYQTG